MVVRAEVVVDPRRLNAALRKYPEVVAKHMHRAVRDDGDDFLRAMVDRMRGGGSIRSRSGDLARSFKRVVQPPSPPNKLERIVGRAFSAGAVHALTQEFGGTITPRVKKLLAFPPPDGTTARGRPRVGYFIKQSGLTATGKPRYVTDRGERTRLIMTGPGKGVVVTKKLGVIRILRDKVTLKPILGFFDTWQSQRGRRIKRHARALNRALREVTRGGGA